jgi:hypothetical protein
VTLENGAEFGADWLISTPPVPEVHYQNLPFEGVTELKYERCLALAVLLERPSLIPEPGALQMEHEVLAWMADNFQKGISKRPGAVTLHASGAWSEAHHRKSDEVIVKTMLEAAGPWLGAEVVAYQLRRWECAKTVNPVSVGAREISERKLVLAGDSFAGAKIEGAVISGLRAAAKVRG